MASSHALFRNLLLSLPLNLTDQAEWFVRSMAVDDTFCKDHIFISRYFLCTTRFFFMISLIHVYEFLNIGIVFPVRNGFQQDLFSPTGITKLSNTERVLNCRSGGFLIFLLFWHNQAASYVAWRELVCLEIFFRKRSILLRVLAALDKKKLTLGRKIEAWRFHPQSVYFPRNNYD